MTGTQPAIATKTSVILNGRRTGRASRAADIEPEAEMETEEEEEEEEEDTSSPETLPTNSPSPSSIHSYQQQDQQSKHLPVERGRESGNNQQQEPHSGSQFPLSGDLPSMDPGLPSPSLGFELPEVSPRPCNYLTLFCNPMKHSSCKCSVPQNKLVGCDRIIILFLGVCFAVRNKPVPLIYICSR